MTIDKIKLTHKRLKSILDYNPNTGMFKWKVLPKKSTRNKIGCYAGCLNINDGYVVIVINGKTYRAHRLAWFYFYGNWPKRQVDHIDMDKQNNSIKNLRDVTARTNKSNNKLRQEGRLLGTSRHDGKWQARIYINPKDVHLGTFNTELEAHEAYKKALAELVN